MGNQKSSPSQGNGLGSALPAAIRTNINTVIRRARHPHEVNEQHDVTMEGTMTPSPGQPGVLENSSGTQTVCYGKPFLLRWEPPKQTLLEKFASNALGSLSSLSVARLSSSSSSSSSASAGAMTPVPSPEVPVASSSSSPERRGPAWRRKRQSNSRPRSRTIGSRRMPSKTSRFWCTNESSRDCYLGEVAQTSLLTFHGQNANAVNVRGTTAPLISVQDESIITIYANVGNGRYLTYEYVSGSLRFVSSPQDVRTSDATARACEFFVRRSGSTATSQAPASGTMHERHRTSSSQTANANTTERPPLVFGEQVTLESVALPGHYLAICLPLAPTSRDKHQQADVPHPNMILVNSLEKAARFVLHSPTLRELVQLNAGNTSGTNAASSNAADFLTLPDPDGSSDHTDDFQLAETKAQAERERQWMEAIAHRLPVDLAKRIFSYHRDWTRTARLVCKSWMIHAEKSIRRVRVNGEFCSLDTDEERTALIAFVRRCPNLEVLTLRNVMMLSDEDIAEIAENKNLKGLVLGGCRRLSDRSTATIARKLPNLHHLNLAFTNITDESLRIVAQVEHLKELNLYNCPRVTVDGVNRSADIPEGLTSLEHMNLRGTIADGHLVQDFKRKRPSVVVLTGPASADSIWG